MPRLTGAITVLFLVVLIGWALGCSAARKPSDTTGPWSRPSASLLFGEEAELTSATSVYRQPQRPPPSSWEVIRTFNSGRTRISAVRHNGDVREYYTSTSGPNGSTARRRVVARSSNAHRGHRR